MDRPRKPGKGASAAEWDRYRTDLAAWQTEQRGSLGRFAIQHTPPPVDEVKAIYNPATGVTKNLFGGYGREEGDGDWHGHYDVDEGGATLYGRPPGERR